MRKSVLFLAIASVFALSGCGAGEEPYKEFPKDIRQVSTADIDKASERQYLYIRSVGKAPRYAAAIRGFTQGDPKLVTLRRTAKGIQVRQIDRDTIGLGHDTRWDTDMNLAPILTIPGKYIDFKCTEDKWRECINVEQENKDANLTWDQKRYFVPDFSEPKVAELNINDLFTFGECVEEVGTPRLLEDASWKGYEMDLDKGVLNLEIEHTYQASMSCINQFYRGSLDNLSFSTTEFISIVAVDQLASADYKALPYSEDEKGTYGFFTSSHNYRDATDSDGVDGYVRTYMNRFNPAKESVTYHLSNNFFEPKNKPFLDAAYESVTAINLQNAMFKTGFPEVKLAQANDKHHGDLRYSNITLFDEPLDNGLAGYGPSAANPLTGEIVSARVNQYSSNLKQGAVRYYRQVRLDYNRGKLDADTTSALTGVEYQKAAEVSDSPKLVVSAEAEAAYEQPQHALLVSAPALPVRPKDNSFTALAEFEQSTQDYWSEHSMMHVDNVYATGGSTRQLPAGIKGHEIDWQTPELWVDGSVGGKLIAFEKMPVSLQDELTTKLAAQAFAGTLTHELGHTFGLRHNFAGSRDHDNTFTQAQLEAMDKAFADAGYPGLTANAEFSSQMDYNVNRFATTFEPYDLAALRFGYAREVETETGEFVSLKVQDDKRREELRNGIVNGETRFGALYNVAQDNELRSYAFCTDGHVSLNSNCNRGDAGADLDEIAQFYIDRYQDSYETMNLRHNRQVLFEDQAISYALSRKALFNDIRQFIEDSARRGELEEKFNLPSDFWVKNCEELASQGEDAWYCAASRAEQRAAEFFLTLMGEKDATVDLFLNWKDGRRQRFDSMSLSKFQERYGSSLGLEPGEVLTHLSNKTAEMGQAVWSGLKPEFQSQLTVEAVVGGRLLNGLKAPISSPDHPYVNERDVLGVWPDKLLAVRALVGRTTNRSTSGRSYNALVDLPEVHTLFTDMLCEMTVGDGIGFGANDALTLVNACHQNDDLEKFLPQGADFVNSSIEALPSYPNSVASFFGFATSQGAPKGRSNLLEMMLYQVVDASWDSDYRGEQKARLWREHVGIHLDGPALATEASIVLNGRNYVATSENVLALALIRRINEIDAWMVANPDSLATEPFPGTTIGELLNGQVSRDRQVLTYLPVL
ncbi:zinc-dependent metalloprotease [Ferrimonas sp. SCSIO 43195]|uniref:zinc-dependent metalloprotease n=1 Tax=Ferrimonas sp. SCSIO 43195 TaxID=2822844 RepID=UPI0020758CA6|nr:zinc-dependent metalloprotease [Ferrimonas sp. SCSIO 43195]USD38714.1 zinc-dependent metalloprotease [Ferrimonas sp. SCSIO 43195]